MIMQRFYKNIVPKAIIYSFLTLSLILWGGLASAQALPSATTQPAQSIAARSAILTGNVNPNNAHTNIWFEYGQTSSLGTSTGRNAIGSGSSSVERSIVIFNLIPNTTYYYKVVAENSYGISRGSILNFQTLSESGPNNSGTNNSSTNNNSNNSPNSLPSVSLGSPTSISQNSVLLGGTVNSNGSDTSFWFEYGQTSSLGTQTSSQSLSSGNTNTSVSGFISNLKPNTTYYFRLAARNNNGTSVSNISTFITQSGSGGIIQERTPEAITNGPSIITNNTAVIHGTISPNSSIAYYWFAYGPTTSLGSKTSVGQIVTTNYDLTGSTPQQAEGTLSGLQSGTVYYYRIIAQNGKGISEGVITSFVTSGAKSISSAVSMSSQQIGSGQTSGGTGAGTTGATTASLISSTSATNNGKILGAKDSVILSVSNEEPLRGEEFNYTVIYRNIQNGDMKDVSIRVILPPEVEYVNSNVAPHSRSESMLTFKLGNLTRESQGAIIIKVRLLEPLSVNSSIILTVMMESRDISGEILTSVGYLTIFSGEGKVSDNRSGAASILGSFIGSIGGVLWILVVVLALLMAFFLIRYKRQEKQKEQIRKPAVASTSNSNQEEDSDIIPPFPFVR